MKHEMRLQNDPFIKVKNGTKTVELRLYDVKRKALKVGDQITFTNVDNKEKIDVNIINLEKYQNFEELFSHYDKKSMGLEKETTPEYMEKYYTKDEIKKYGTLAITIEKV